MATFSFDVEFSTTAQEYRPPEGYDIELHGDSGEPSNEEFDCVMIQTVPELARLAEDHRLASHPVEIRGEKGNLEELKSNHYTWRVKRSDGMPLMPPEVQIALFSFSANRWAEERAREPVVSMPLVMLARLLKADDLQRRDLSTVLTDVPRGGEVVHIQDEAIAVRLAALGLLAGTDAPCFYLLQNIEVK